MRWVSRPTRGPTLNGFVFWWNIDIRNVVEDNKNQYCVQNGMCSKSLIRAIGNILLTDKEDNGVIVKGF